MHPYEVQLDDELTNVLREKYTGTRALAPVIQHPITVFNERKADAYDNLVRISAKKVLEKLFVKITEEDGNSVLNDFDKIPGLNKYNLAKIDGFGKALGEALERIRKLKLGENKVCKSCFY